MRTLSQLYMTTLGYDKDANPLAKILAHLSLFNAKPSGARGHWKPGMARLKVARNRKRSKVARRARRVNKIRRRR